MKNKILPVPEKIVSLFLIFMGLCSVVSAQLLPVSSYGLPYVNSVSLYKKTIKGHPEKIMISLNHIPGVFLQLRYATKNNFTHKRLYPENTDNTYLRQPALIALKELAVDLKKRGMGIIVYDAYRPYSVTENFWLLVKDDRYAANPSQGSGHNRGIAIDLTLCDLKTLQPFLMPTGFDNFSDSAHQNFMKLDSVRIKNRSILKNEMMKFGFVPLETEWWHYSLPDPDHFEILDLSFEQLNSASKN